MNYFEIEEHDGFLKQDTVERAVECDNFVRENGKEMFWSIPLERRLNYEKCPLGDVFFCELNIKKNNLSKSKNKMCPFMYSRRKIPCQLEKYKDRIELMDAQKISRKEIK